MRWVGDERRNSRSWKSVVAVGPRVAAVDSFPNLNNGGAIKYGRVCRVKSDAQEIKRDVPGYVSPGITTVRRLPNARRRGGIDYVIGWIDRDAIDGMKTQNAGIELRPGGA